MKFNAMGFKSALMGIDKKDQTFVKNSYKVFGMDNLNNKKIIKFLANKGRISNVVTEQKLKVDFMEKQKEF